MKSLQVCFFCKRPIEFGTGRSIISTTGIEMAFCSGKCLKNQRLGRDPDSVGWIRKVRKTEVPQ